VASLGSGLAGHEKFDSDYVLARRPNYITTWLDAQGRFVSPGLESVNERLARDYELAAVVLMRRARPGESAWVELNRQAYTEELHWLGYIYGVLRLRQDH
jgi:hypothetical protein